MKIELDEIKQLRSELIQSIFGTRRMRITTRSRKETYLTIKALYSIGIKSISTKDISNKSALSRRWNNAEKRNEVLIVEVDMWNLRHLWNNCITLYATNSKLVDDKEFFIDFRTFMKCIKKVRKELRYAK